MLKSRSTLLSEDRFRWRGSVTVRRVSTRIHKKTRSPFKNDTVTTANSLSNKRVAIDNRFTDTIIIPQIPLKIYIQIVNKCFF